MVRAVVGLVRNAVAITDVCGVCVGCAIMCPLPTAVATRLCSKGNEVGAKIQQLHLGRLRINTLSPI